MDFAKMIVWVICILQRAPIVRYFLMNKTLGEKAALKSRTYAIIQIPRMSFLGKLKGLCGDELGIEMADKINSLMNFFDYIGEDMVNIEGNMK